MINEVKVRNVLLIEDSPADADLISELLSENTAINGIEITHVTRLGDGLNRLEENSVDAILLDLFLPDSKGLEGIRKIKSKDASVPVIVLTNMPEEAIGVMAVQQGAQDFIPKSELSADLLARSLTYAVERNFLHTRVNQSEARLRMVVMKNADAMLIVNREGIVRFANPAAEKLLDLKTEKLVGMHLGHPIQSEDGTEIDVLVHRSEDRTAEMRVVEIEWEKEAAFLISLHDITHRKKLENDLKLANKRLEHLATVDPLTSTFNRRGLQSFLTQELNRIQRAGTSIAVLLVDCDDFKFMNDRFGHASGDIILKKVADRIAASLRSSDCLGRVGGDEFLIILPDCRLGEAVLVAEKIRLAVAGRPVMNDPETINQRVSIGVAMLPYNVASLEEVLSLTRHGLHQSKHSGKNRVSISLGEAVTADQFGEQFSDVLEKMGSGEGLRVLLQPIVLLEDEMVVGYELLCRGPEGPFEKPTAMFHLASEYKMLTRVDLQCLRSCIDVVGGMGGRGQMHVNLFPSTLLNVTTDDFLEMFPEKINKPSFCIELSEQQFIGYQDELLERVVDLKEAGFLVAMDDVGGGYGTLDSIVLLEPDIVKIDKELIQGVASDDWKERVLRRLIRLTDALGVEVVAEGVEGRNDLHLLRDLGIGFGQGFLWAEPMEAANLS